MYAAEETNIPGLQYTYRGLLAKYMQRPERGSRPLRLLCSALFGGLDGPEWFKVFDLALEALVCDVVGGVCLITQEKGWKVLNLKGVVSRVVQTAVRVLEASAPSEDLALSCQHLGRFAGKNGALVMAVFGGDPRNFEPNASGANVPDAFTQGGANLLEGSPRPKMRNRTGEEQAEERTRRSAENIQHLTWREERSDIAV